MAGDRDGDGYADDEYLAPADQLTLTDDDERLPWLESGDEDYAEPAVDTGRIVALAILALLALAAFVAYMNRFQIRPEERALREKFGATFDAYARAVRRWL